MFAATSGRLPDAIVLHQHADIGPQPVITVGGITYVLDREVPAGDTDFAAIKARRQARLGPLIRVSGNRLSSPPARDPGSFDCITSAALRHKLQARYKERRGDVGDAQHHPSALPRSAGNVLLQERGQPSDVPIVQNGLVCNRTNVPGVGQTIEDVQQSMPSGGDGRSRASPGRQVDMATVVRSIVRLQRSFKERQLRRMRRVSSIVAIERMGSMNELDSKLAEDRVKQKAHLARVVQCVLRIQRAFRHIRQRRRALILQRLKTCRADVDDDIKKRMLRRTRTAPPALEPAFGHGREQAARTIQKWFRKQREYRLKRLAAILLDRRTRGDNDLARKLQSSRKSDSKSSRSTSVSLPNNE